jgi:GntR family transcriptional regulator, rspAB operon transcriptional repressor
MKLIEDKPFSVVQGRPGSATERVLAAIRSAIVELELPPGSMIDKTALCERFGVSRFPVSDALTRLQSEGLVEVLPQRGTRVTRMRMADIAQAMFIRRALEVEMVRTLAPNMSDDLRTKLEMNIGYQEVTIGRADPRAFHLLDLAFHEMLLEDLNYPRVAAAVDAARHSLERARRILSSPQRHANTLAEHKAILAALTTRNPEAAAVAMKSHLDAVLAEITTFMKIDTLAFETP